MPGGPGLAGVVYFAAVKFAGYSAAGEYIRRTEKLERPNPFVFGGVRTVVGIAAGIAYALLLAGLDVTHENTAFYVGLVPIRILEWLLLLVIFYGEVPDPGRKWIWYIAAGVVWSYLLDLPAVLAIFALPGGVWIC